MTNKTQVSIDYSNFNGKKFSKTFKNISHQSLIIGRFKITNKYEETNKTNRIIYKILNSIIRNPLIFKNNMIDIVINEVYLHIEFLKLFRDSIKTAHSIDGIERKQNKLIEKQIELKNHLLEINKNPNQLPSFLKV